ncbi:NADH-quinone oxidoreductase subunit NuoN [Permianibacter aggregans]|uniref:NADH-quinone oxidoreductase subunit N n=1 Tax=Permianibacter aggregans TaxID=1510150 RepID=A0A4V3D6G9_9GAMM|nr:NADH-quinone oxidoreductase subunit NuoN [Permianibacter aggregans]QGX40591.1 NADH-quinone oxidoreductase subunit NuoN [Permianibacter aggregans]TDQ43847.1 NADH dehydrogenase subunit N [Permianibacter aggregans]
MFETPNLYLMSAEIFLVIATCLVMLVDLFFAGAERKNTYAAAMLSLAGTLLVTLQLYEVPEAILYSGHYVHDQLAIILKVAIYIVSMIALMYARTYIAERQFLRGEYYLLTLFAVLGANVLVAAGSMLTIYLGLELMSLSLYAMVAMQRDSHSAPEAAMKYFVMGALASGFLLWGMSLLYGVTGSLQLDQIAQLPSSADQLIIYRFAMIFIVAAIAFKLGAVPFHMWIPDIYHGAPTSVVAFLGSAPKIAAFGMIIRLLTEAMPGISADWTAMLVMLAVLSLAIGNIGAIMQSNLKRLLAYSAIAHMGYFVIGLTTGNNEGFAASMFYMLVYALMTLGGFGMILFLSRAGFESDEISHFKGLWQRSPWHALLMMFILMSMAGIPPFVGFWPKLQIFMAAVNSGQVGLAIYAAVMSLIGAYYYLKVVKVMFFDTAEDMTPIKASTSLQLAISANGLAMLVLGLFPSVILAWCLQAFA